MANEIQVEISVEEREALRALTRLTQQADRTSKETEKSFKKMDLAVASFAGNLSANLAGRAIGSVVSGLKSLVNVSVDSVNASARQEDAVNKLNAALRQSGNFSEEASQDIQRFASELQKVTKIGDEAALEQIAFAQSMGATVDQSKIIVAAAADMSEALNIDLNSAVRNISKTIGGYAGELGEVIPELKNLTQEQLRAGEGIDLLADRFRGQAAAATQTFSGALQQTQNIIGDTQESLGSLITSSPEIIKIMKGVGEIFLFAGQKIDENKESIQAMIADGIQGSLVGGLSLGVDAFVLFNDAMTTTQNFMDFVADGAISVGQEIMRFAQVGVEAASAFYSAFGKDTSPLDDLNQDIQKNIELLELNKQKRMEDVASRSEENEILKQQALEFKEFSVQALSDRLTAENEVKAEARAIDAENEIASNKKKKDDQLMTEQQIIDAQGEAFKKKLALQQAETKAFAFQQGQINNIASNAANFLTAVQGEQSKAAFLLGKISAAGQVMIADSQARAAATAAAAAASIAAGPGAPAAFGANLAFYNGLITANTALALGTIAAQTFSGLADGGIIGQGATRGGDNMLQPVRTGEMVLNADQQEQLFKNLSGGGIGGEIVIQIDGREIARAVRDQRQQGFAV